MAERAEKAMTIDEFHLWQQGQEERYELVDGFPLQMMTGATNYHDAVLVNIVASLHGQLRGSRCRATTPDTAVRTRIRTLRRPDVTVTCDDPRPESCEAANPRLVVEVLSPSNAGRAWQRKLDEYFRHERLAYVLLVDSGAVGATLYTRTGETWEPADFESLDDVIGLPEIGCKLALRDVYEGLEFPAAG